MDIPCSEAFVLTAKPVPAREYKDKRLSACRERLTAALYSDFLHTSLRGVCEKKDSKSEYSYGSSSPLYEADWLS